MIPVRRPTPSNPLLAAIAFATLAFTAVRPAASQGLVEYSVGPLPLNTGFSRSAALGIDERGWEPLTVVGKMVNAHDKATCWIRVSQQWSAHELPGLDPNAASWANGVSHVPGPNGEVTTVVGAAVDGTGTTRPMSWDNVKNMPWQARPLPTLNAGDGEAHAVFHPDGTPVRAVLCGSAGETQPAVTAGGRRSTATTIGVPMIWETTAVGERILRPDFGAGLAGVVKTIGSAGANGFVAFGGGQNGAGAWTPQMWTSTDDGETWTNNELPLPLGALGGEVVDFEYDAAGRLTAAGWAEGRFLVASPALWERDLSDPQGTWMVHELPLPSLTDGGQSTCVRKRPGRTTYAGISTSAGGAEMDLWIDEGNGWVLQTPAEYLSNPQTGTPIAPAGIDGFGRIAATVALAPPTASASFSALQSDTVASLLVPVPLTGAGDRAPSPPRLITLSAAPNPFNPRVRIAYTLPRDAEVTVTIHDAAGRVVKRANEGFVPAGEERGLFWDGTTDSANHAASGVYFVRVATPYEIATVKIVMVE